MKRSCLLLLLLLGSGPLLSAQESTVRTRSLIHPDGSHTDATMDFEARTMEEKTYSVDNHLLRHVTYTLDENHQPVASVVYDLQGQPLYKATYEQDVALNRVKEEHRFTMEGQFIEKLIFYYNPQGAVARTEVIDAQGRTLTAETASRRRASTRPVRQAAAIPARPVPTETVQTATVQTGVVETEEAPVVRRAVPVQKGPSVQMRSSR